MKISLEGRRFGVASSGTGGVSGTDQAPKIGGGGLPPTSRGMTMAKKWPSGSHVWLSHPTNMAMIATSTAVTQKQTETNERSMAITKKLKQERGYGLR